MRNTHLTLMLILIPCLVMAGAHSPLEKDFKAMEILPIMTGNEECNVPVCYPPYNTTAQSGAWLRWTMKGDYILYG